MSKTRRTCTIPFKVVKFDVGRKHTIHEKVLNNKYNRPINVNEMCVGLRYINLVSPEINLSETVSLAYYCGTHMRPTPRHLMFHINDLVEDSIPHTNQLHTHSKIPYPSISECIHGIGGLSCTVH